MTDQGRYDRDKAQHVFEELAEMLLEREHDYYPRERVAGKLIAYAGDNGLDADELCARHPVGAAWANERAAEFMVGD